MEQIIEEYGVGIILGLVGSGVIYVLNYVLMLL